MSPGVEPLDCHGNERLDGRCTGLSRRTRARRSHRRAIGARPAPASVKSSSLTVTTGIHADERLGCWASGGPSAAAFQLAPIARASHQLRDAHAVEMAREGVPADRHPTPAWPHEPRHHLRVSPGPRQTPRSSTPFTRDAPRWCPCTARSASDARGGHGDISVPLSCPSSSEGTRHRCGRGVQGFCFRGRPTCSTALPLLVPRGRLQRRSERSRNPRRKRNRAKVATATELQGERPAPSSRR